MRSILAPLSLGLLWIAPVSIAHAAASPEPAATANAPSASPVQLAQWTQEQEDLYDAQRAAERQRAAEQSEQMRQDLRNYQQQWQNDTREWTTRRVQQNERLQDRWEQEYDQYYGDSENRYIDGHLYRTYGDRDSNTWTFRLRYSDDDLGVDSGLVYRDYYRTYPYPYERDEYYYEPRIVDRVYVPLLVPSFGNNDFVQVELVSANRSNVSVTLLGSDGSQQLAFDAFNQSQALYLPAGTYQIAFVDAMNNRTWLSGYLDLGFSPSIRIEFDQTTGTANLYGDPQAWRTQ